MEYAARSPWSLPESPLPPRRWSPPVPIALSLRPSTAGAATVPWTMHALTARPRATPRRTKRSVDWYTPSRSPEALRAALHRAAAEHKELGGEPSVRAAVGAAREERVRLGTMVHLSRSELTAPEAARVITRLSAGTQMTPIESLHRAAQVLVPYP
jgi:hypothetical protein